MPELDVSAGIGSLIAIQGYGSSWFLLTVTCLSSALRQCFSLRLMTSSVPETASRADSSAHLSRDMEPPILKVHSAGRALHCGIFWKVRHIHARHTAAEAADAAFLLANAHDTLSRPMREAAQQVWKSGSPCPCPYLLPDRTCQRRSFQRSYTAGYG